MRLLPVFAALLAGGVAPDCLLDAAPNVLLEDADVRVVLATNTPGQKSSLHKHDRNRIMIALDAGAMRLAFDDGTVKDRSWQAGDWWWDPSGGMHTSENTGGTTYRLIEVELKRPGGGAVQWPEDDPVAAAPAFFHTELDNPQVRLLRLKLEPRQKTPIHSHLLPRVMVYLNDQQLRLTLPNGRGSTFRYRAGQVTKGGKARNAKTNLGSQTAESLLIELKPNS
jgi:quercetin dioxygenase-like cupin family protein